MIKQVFHPYFIFTLAVLSFADQPSYGLATKGDCVLHRQYQDSKRIPQHFSVDPIQEGRNSPSSCSSMCKRSAKSIPALHATAIKDTNTTKVEFTCLYDGKQAQNSNYRTVWEAILPTRMMKIEKATANTPTNAPATRRTPTTRTVFGNGTTTTITTPSTNAAPPAKRSTESYLNPRRQRTRY